MSRPRLTLSPDKIIAGVCGGVAEYFGWEPLRVRQVAFVLAMLTFIFPALIIYLLLWYIMPGNDF